MSAQPIDFSKYESGAVPAGQQIDFSKYEPGAAQPAQPPSFWDSLEREGKSAVGSIAGIPAAVYHAFAEPATQEEKDKFGGEQEVSGAKRIGLGIHRLATAPVENAVNWYGKAMKGEIPYAYEQALSVAPEAMGSAGGNVIGGKLVEMAPGAARAAAEAVPPVVRATARGVNKGLAKAPGTIGGTAGAAVGGYLGGHVGADIGGLAGAMAGREILPQVRIPGEGFGLPDRVTGGPAEAPAYQESTDAPEEPAQPLPKPKAKTVKQSGALGPDAQPRTQAQALAAPRTVVTDPATGRPEFSDVVEAKQAAAAPETKPAPAATTAPVSETPAPQPAAAATPAETPAAQPGPAAADLLDRLKGIADRISKQEAAAPGSADEDLTQQLQDSLELVRARKAAQAAGNAPGGASSSTLPEEIPAGGVRTTADPGELTKRWGVTGNSIAGTDADLRGMNLKQSQEYVNQLAESYKNGRPVEPVLETRDADNNIVDVDGRHRALAAQKAGIERIPIVIRRLGVTASAPEELAARPQ